MEINDYSDIRGAVAQESIVEGRMVLLTTNTFSRNYGSQTDLPGVKKPDTRAEAARARYCVTFEQDNRSLPIYQPQPRFDDTLRYGFEETENAPFNADVYLVHPGVQEGRTIPSGEGVALYQGILTVPSGDFVYSVALETPGTLLEVANDADDSAADSGKLKELSAGTAVAEVWEYVSTENKLRFKILY